MSTSPGNNEHNNHLFGGISDSGEYKKCILDNWLIAYSVKMRILIRFFFSKNQMNHQVNFSSYKRWKLLIDSSGYF